MEKTHRTNLKVEWALLCQSASVDQQTNTISLFNVIEEINLNKTPVHNPRLAGQVETIDLPERTNVPFKYAFVIQMEKDGGVFTADRSNIKVRISNPDQVTIMENEFPIVPNGPVSNRFRAVVNFDGMVVDKSGKYFYTVLSNFQADVYRELHQASVVVKIHP